MRSLREMLNPCRLCPRSCGVDRLEDELGACRTGSVPSVASAGAHFGEEPVLVGRGGSGTVFFCGCNLSCVFCQNVDISQDRRGQSVTSEKLAEIMVRLAAGGCENINFVTPTHVSHAVAEAIPLARKGGCAVPTVYNCGGYESVETLRLLEGLIDIYMPDFKYADAAAGRRYSGVGDYPAVAEAALREMYRQVGPLALDDRGVAARGVLVRHLVLPGDLAGSREVIDRVAEAAPACAINVMGQYHPVHRAEEFPELMASVPLQTVRSLRDYATDHGLMVVH